jgi:hypothetical protein
MSLRWTDDEYKAFLRRTQEIANIQELPIGQPQKPAPTESKLERRFTQQLAENPDIPPHQRNYFFLADRDLELDYAWPGLRVAVEVQGLSHRVKGKFKRDIEKRALAMLAGWRVLEVGGDQVRSGEALTWLRRLLGLNAPTTGSLR